MQSDQLRILELRERLAVGRAPYLYAQLAEEYRRARNLDEAVECCLTCLQRFPDFLSIRVILGRALAEQGHLDAAAREFETVLRHAPDNLTATRDLAEIELRRGRLEQAVSHYQHALVLFKGDADLEARVSALLHQLERPAIAHAPGEGPGAKTDANPQGESTVDFEALLSSLGASGQALPPLMEMLLASPSNSVLQALASVRTQLSSDAPVDPGPARPAEPARERAVTSASGPRRSTRAEREIAALERWLRVLQTPSADPHAHRPA